MIRSQHSSNAIAHHQAYPPSSTSLPFHSSSPLRSSSRKSASSNSSSRGRRLSIRNTTVWQFPWMTIGSTSSASSSLQTSASYLHGRAATGKKPAEWTGAYRWACHDTQQHCWVRLLSSSRGEFDFSDSSQQVMLHQSHSSDIRRRQLSLGAAAAGSYENGYSQLVP